jgi:Schitoviridae DNA polymerase
MRHIVYDSASDTYPIALLVKGTSFNGHEIDQAYVQALEAEGINRNDIIVVALEYNDKGKAPVKFIKEYLEQLMPALESVGVKQLFCADANYFKVLAKQRKAEPHLGYVLKCGIKDYEHMDIVLGINHKALIHNPAQEPKLLLSLETLAQAAKGTYQKLGSDIIKSAYYPESLEDIRDALQDLHRHPFLAMDIEAFSLKAYEAGVATIAFCWNQHAGIAFACDYEPLPEPVDGLFGKYTPNEKVRKLLREFFENYKGIARWHNATYDIKVLIATLWMEHDQDINGLLKGLEILTENFEDTKIIAYLATNSTAGNELSLKAQAQLFAGNWAQEEIKDIRKIPLAELLQYNLVDGLATNYVFDKHFPTMIQDCQHELYESLMKPSLKTIIQMELVGMPMAPGEVGVAKGKLQDIVDEQDAVFKASPTISKFNNRLQQEKMEATNAKLKVKQHPLSKFTDVQFNPNSNQQLQKLLYEEMGLPVLDRTKAKAPSTKADVIEKLLNHTADEEYTAVLNALVARGKADKILSTFIPAFEAGRLKADGMKWLHGNFNLGGTVSGRLSSSDPNMTNLPSGSLYGKLIKNAFRPPKSWVFCGSDFNALEATINALLTKDPNKLRVYEQGLDSHSWNTFGYWPDKMPDIENTIESINSIKQKYPELRSKSKGPTFSLTFQGTWLTLVKNSGFTEEEAKKIEANYHKLYEVSTQWVKDRIAQAAEDGYATGAFGLRIRTPLLKRTLLGKSSTPREAEAEARTLGNAISGQSYGLLNNRAANAVMERVWKSKYRFDILPVALIHDAIYFIARDNLDVIEWLNNVLIEEMEWQELPEIKHETVKLGAELDLFWPSWADPVTLPNNATQSEILTLTKDHLKRTAETN